MATTPSDQRAAPHTGSSEQSGRVVVVTGAGGQPGRGMGPAIVEAFAATGAKVVAADVNGESAESIASAVRQGGGTIVNTISVAGIAGGRSGAAYTASKHGLVGLTRHIASSYGHQNVRCAGGAPGVVRGTDSLPADENRAIAEGPEFERLNRWPGLPAVHALSPRVGHPHEVAAVVAFLASESASFINGAIIPVDAGWTAV